jgi:PTS system nitrogen regulatory IIA component
MQLNVKAVVALLNVPEKTVYRWIAKGRIPFYRVNDQYRFNRAELLEWATRERLNVSADLMREPEEGPVPSLEEAVRAGGVHYRVEGRDKPEALRAVVQILPLPDEVDRDFLLQVLMVRESMESTGIGNGVAIPHVRNPIVLHIPKPIVTLSFLEHPIDFQAIDGQPVHALFTIVSPTTRAHLHLLSRLMYGLRSVEFSEMIRLEASREEIFRGVQAIDSHVSSPAQRK